MCSHLTDLDKCDKKAKGIEKFVVKKDIRELQKRSIQQ